MPRSTQFIPQNGPTRDLLEAEADHAARELAAEMDASPVFSNVPVQQEVMARVARRHSEQVNASNYEQSADPQTQALRQLESAGLLPQYLLDGAAFRDKVMSAMPQLADRLIDYLKAQAVVMFDQKGRPYVEVNEASKILAPAQIKLLEKLLGKFIPQQSEANQLGQQRDPSKTAGPRKVTININQIGETPDYSKVPGSVDGISHAAARQTATIKINAKKPVVIDAQPSPAEPTNTAPAGATETRPANAGEQDAQSFRENDHHEEDAEEIQYEESRAEAQADQRAENPPRREEGGEDREAGREAAAFRI